MRGGDGLQFHSFLTLAPDKGGESVTCHGLCINHGERLSASTEQDIIENSCAILHKPNEYLTWRRLLGRAADMVVDSRNAPPFTTSKGTLSYS